MSISEATIKRLWGRAHNQCAATGCHQDLTQGSSDGEGIGDPVILGEQAHIRGKKPGSARHDPQYEDVDGYQNLILLCPTHHTEIDKEGGKNFSVDQLVKLKRDHEQKWERHDRRLVALKAYLAQTYGVDDTTRFEQVDLQPRVDAIFVDVAVGARRGSSLEPLLTEISENAPGDVAPADRSMYAVTGGAQALLHPNWSGGALLVGGPGQGKSTLLQFVCQFHRARLLGKVDAYTGSQQALRDTTTRFRYPIRVELREYVAWAKKNPMPPQGKRKGSATRPPGRLGKQKPSWPALEQFVANHVQQYSGGLSFTVKDLTSVVASEPILLALDGLDEVAALVDREEVSRQIIRTRDSLDALGIDIVVLVATRPGAETASLWSAPAFPQLQLLPLTQGLRLQYFQRWTEAANLTPPARDALQDKLLSQQHELHIKELASTPMQLAILLHLLQRKGRLPQERTALYSQYIQTFLDREEGQDKEPLLGEQRDLIERVHEFLAWSLQSAAEQGSSGSISRDELRQVLRVNLMDQPDGLDFAQKLFDSFEARVMCLVEREGRFEFQIQSLREYFAAVHIANTVGLTSSKDARLKALLARPYWSNVTRFFVGDLAPGEVKGLRYTLVDAADDKTLGVHPMLRSMAFLLLEDRCFQGQPNLVLREMVDFILAGPGLFFAEDGLVDPTQAPLRFSERAGRAQAVEHLRERVLGAASSLERQAAAACLARHATPGDALTGWWWEQFKPTVDWLEVAGHLGCLNDVSRVNRQRLSAAVNAVASTGRAAPFLSRLEDPVREAVATLIEELDAAKMPAHPDDRGVVGRLLTASHGTHRAPSSASRPRSRGRRVAGRVTGLPAIEHAAEHIARLGPLSTDVEWSKALAAVADAWTDHGWVLRDQVARIPTSVDLADLVACLPEGNDRLADLVELEATRRRCVGDPDFWFTSMPSSAGVDGVDWVVALLTKAHTSTIIAVLPQFSVMVGKLSRVELAVAADAIARRGRATNLGLADHLRLNRLKGLSIVELQLLLAASDGGTKDQLNKKLVAAAKGGKATDFMNATEVAHGIGKINVEWFRGSRSTIPSGATLTVQLTGLNQPTARSILREPAEWPAFVVHLAAQKVRVDLDKQEPLSAIAERERWFAQSD